MNSFKQESVAADHGSTGGCGHSLGGNHEYLAAPFKNTFAQIIEQVIALRVIAYAEMNVPAAIMDMTRDFPIRLDHTAMGSIPTK